MTKIHNNTFFFSFGTQGVFLRAGNFASLIVRRVTVSYSPITLLSVTGYVGNITVADMNVSPAASRAHAPLIDVEGDSSLTTVPSSPLVPTTTSALLSITNVTFLSNCPLFLRSRGCDVSIRSVSLVTTSPRGSAMILQKGNYVTLSEVSISSYHDGAVLVEEVANASFENVVMTNNNGETGGGVRALLVAYLYIVNSTFRCILFSCHSCTRESERTKHLTYRVGINRSQELLRLFLSV